MTDLVADFRLDTSALDNPIFDTDSYKYSHYLQNPPNTLHVSSYIEARPGGRFDHLVLFGLQGFLKRYLMQPITQAMIDQAEPYIRAHGLPFNREGFERIVTKHGGHWPVEIEALPEGSIVPVGVPVAQVVNTDDQLPWIGSFLETALLRAIWYPTTVATLSWHAKQIIRSGLERTCDDPEPVLPFRLHDFGARGATSREASQIGGAAHLVNFQGTDTVEGMVWANAFYDAGLPGFSIPAAEHSTMTAWGERRERDAYRNMVEQFGGDGALFAVVSDSYDLDNAVNNIWGSELKQNVQANGGTLVVRPDSGDPVAVPIRVLQSLEASYGVRTNAKGYKVLADCVRVIQGDGMDLETIARLVDAVAEAGFSLENIAFGMGGGLLQKVNRDTLRWAQKANAISVRYSSSSDEPIWEGINKVVATDPSKSSKRGRQSVVVENDEMIAVRRDQVGRRQDLLRPVFRDGALVSEVTFAEVRERADQTD
ncbi:MAG: nicotinate phosphoribosyltransferase [Pseudomonadota bacterium]